MREADALIAAGAVTVNGAVATLGVQVGEGDDVRVHGKRLGAKKKHVYIALNKPVGITCTTDRRDPTNIVDYLDHEERIFPVGRLDKDSDGLILLTNNGDIVNDILRAAHNHEKEYIVSVDRPLTPADLERSKVSSTAYVRYRDYFLWPVGIALLCLCVESFWRHGPGRVLP